MLIYALLCFNCPSGPAVQTACQIA